MNDVKNQVERFIQNQTKYGGVRTDEGFRKKKCSGCGCKDWVFFKRINAKGYTIFRGICTNCGRVEAAQRIDNAEKRQNNCLNLWAKAVKDRDENRCRICGSTENLHAHHIIPVSHDKEMKYKYDINNGICLCQKCHEMVHSEKVAKIDNCIYQNDVKENNNE